MRILIEKQNTNMRLDVFIHNNFLNRYSREHTIRLIKNEMITVNGKPVKAGYKTSFGDEIIINENIYPDTPSSRPQDIPLAVVYEDSELLVIDKPRGMVVHPGNGNHDGTLVNALMFHSKGDLSSLNGMIRPGIVHRIDKDTSGLILIAKNNITHEFLSGQFKNHMITKEYLAICEGLIEHNKIKIDKPIARNRYDRKKMDIVSDGKRAVSNIFVIERFKNSTYIKVNIETGRTHQIRVHLKSIGHPLIGDTKYGSKNALINGQALHAYKLGFIHPIKKDYVEFTKDPPKDFMLLIDFLKKM